MVYNLLLININLGFLVKALDKVKVYKSGPMVLYMKVGGKIIKLMVKEDLYMLMEIFTMVIGKMIRLMDMEYIVT
jgi:hypothetical protein